MIDLFEQHEEDQVEGRVGSKGRIDLDTKRSTDIMIRRQKHWRETDDLLFDSIAEAIKELSETFPDFFGSGRTVEDRGYQIQRTDANGFYSWHYDGDHADKTRMLVAIWYLNDVADDQGGKTEFLESGVTIQPQAGKMVLFPTAWTHYHRGGELLYGTKYIATTWIATTPPP